MATVANGRVSPAFIPRQKETFDSWEKKILIGLLLGCKGNCIQGIGASSLRLCKLSSGPCKYPPGWNAKVQNGAARFATRTFSYENGSMTGILEQLKWESLKQRRKQGRLILFYKGLNAKASIHHKDLVHPDRITRNIHPMAFRTLHSRTDIYNSVFTQDR